MFLCIDVVGTDRRLDALECRERTVRAIGEILPLVMARYGLNNTDGHQPGSREAREFDYSI